MSFTISHFFVVKKTKKQKKMSKDTQCTDPAPEADNITVYEHICSDSGVGSAHSTQKICRILGSEVDPIHDPFTRTYAPQPPHVKQYKMKKRFGEEVVVEHATVSSDEDETVESSSHCMHLFIDVASHSLIKQCISFVGYRS